MRALDLTLLTDLYQLTMMQGYFKNPTDQIVVFDAFYRKNPCDGGYAIAAGLEQVIEYIRDLHFTPDDVEYLRSLNIFDNEFLEYLRGFHFTGDIYAIPEGTVVFPREPLLKVIAPVMEAQLIETAILNIMNHQSLIATTLCNVVKCSNLAPCIAILRDLEVTCNIVLVATTSKLYSHEVVWSLQIPSDDIWIIGRAADIIVDK